MRRCNLRPTVLAFTLILLLAACSSSKGTGTTTTTGNAPTITELSPTTSTTGSAPQTLTIYGTNFLSASTVTFNGVMHAATYVSATQLTILLSASDQGMGGTFPVVVTNPPSTNSKAASFQVLNPAPRIDSLSPNDVIAGVSAQTITINGDNFVANSTVTFNGAAIAATILSGTQILINVTAAQQAVQGYYPVVVTNPGPGGGNSNPDNFTVGYPPPVIDSISPTSSLAGAAAQTLTINGLNFLSSSTVTYNGVAHKMTLVNSTVMTIQLTATDQAAAGTYDVVVTNLSPGGGPSNSEPFTVDNPVPTITSISPTSALPGSAALTLTINGTHFLISSQLDFNGQMLSFNYINSTQITTTLSAADLQTAGSYPVEVINPAPGGGTSNAINFGVQNPAPVISSLSPSSAVAGAASETLTINGSNFVSTSTVTYNGVAHSATYVNAGELTISLSASDLAKAGAFPVVVTDPAPGGASNSVNFDVNNPVPVISSLSPSSALAGAASETLTINGSNFIATSTVTYNSVAHTATYVNAGQLTITLSASDLAKAGAFPVVVTNPAPGGGASNSVNFQVNNPVPVITSLSPSSATVGAASETLTINGSNFITASTVTYNGVAHTATYVNAGELTITLSASDLAKTGSFPVVVTNPAPGGGASNSVNFSVGNATNPVPVISSLSPSSALAGAASETLTINGSNFVSSSTVTYNGVSHTATYVSAAQLTITLSVSDLATAGTFAVIVTNPAPGGGASNSVDFQVNNPVPVITSLSPSSATAGSAAETLTINGTGFLSTSTATYNGRNKTVTYLSATELTIQLTNGNLRNAGSYPVIVTNPGPGGGASNTVDFTVTASDAVSANYKIAAPAWQELGPSTQNGNPSANSVSAIAVSGAEILATLEGVSPVQTFNSGESWSVASRADLRSDAPNQAGTVAINPANPLDQYIFSGAGLEYSTDFGQSFSLSGTIPQKEWTATGTANRMAFDPAIPGIALFAAEDGIFESSDFGATWQQTSWPLKSPSMVVVGPDGTIFVGTRGLGEASGTLSVSRDGGASWTPSQLPTSTRETPTSLSVSPANPEMILLGMSGAPSLPGGGVLISTDGGATFTAANDGLPAKSGANAPGPFVTSIQFAPEAYPGVAVVTTIDGVYISQPGGAWTDISGNATSRRFQGIAWDGGYLYVSSYGEGVLRAPIEEILIPQ